MAASSDLVLQPSAPHNSVVFCRGLSFKASEADVRTLLADCGHILSVSMPLDARARPSGTAYVTFDSSDACARAAAKAAAGITHMGRYIEIMQRAQRNHAPAATPQTQDSISVAEVAPPSPGLARILAAQPRRPAPPRHRTPLHQQHADSGNPASGSLPQQRAVTPRRAQPDRQPPWRDPKNAGTPSSHRMPLEVACRICIGAELSGQLSPLEDYEREVTWIEHDLESANERFRTHQKALACLTQDKALLDEQVSQDTKTRAQRSEDRRAQVEALKTAKFTCRQIMQDISRAMPAAALHSDSRRLCTQSELKAQIKRLQEVSEQDPESIVDKPDVHAKPDISINGIRKVWGQSRLILETEKRVSDYIGRLSCAVRLLADAESALSMDVQSQRSTTPGRSQLSGEIRDCVSKRNAARNEVEVLVQMLSIVQKERKRNVRRHDFVVQQHDVAADCGGLCRGVASCGWHFCTQPAGHAGRCEVCPLETVIYCGCRENTLAVHCGRENEHVPCPNCDKYTRAVSQPLSSMLALHSSQPSAGDWVVPGAEWAVQVQSSALELDSNGAPVVAVLEAHDDGRVADGASPALSLDCAKPLAAPLSLDDSVSADRASKKRQLPAAKMCPEKKPVATAARSAAAASDSYDGPIYKPKILSHEAMMARVHDLLKAEELDAASKSEEHASKRTKPKEQRGRAVTPEAKPLLEKEGPSTRAMRSRSKTPAAADSSGHTEPPPPLSQKQEEEQQQQHQQQQQQTHPSSLPPSSKNSIAELQLQEEDIRRRILEVKKQKKGSTSWSAAAGSPYAIAAFFSIIVGVVMCLFLVPEDPRFVNVKGAQDRASDGQNADSYEDGVGRQHQEMQERQEQEQRQRRNMERNQRGDAGDDEEKEDGSAGSIGGEDDDNFYKDDGDDDYAPWDDKPAARNEPAHTRTHRVVQQRIVPAQAGDSFGV